MLCLQAFAVSIPWWDWLFGVGLSVGVLLLVVGVIACWPVSYTHLRANETDSYRVCRLLHEI